MRIFIVLLFATFAFFFSQRANAQLQVTSSNSASVLLSSIIGQGVTVSNVSLNCPNGGAGTFTTGAAGSNLGLSGGMMLTTGRATNAAGPNNQDWVSTNHGVTFIDPNLTALEPLARFDPCILEFDIIPTCGTLSINYVFGSDEYMDWVNSGYNDAFGFFITGPDPGGGNYTGLNIARIAGPNIPVTIDNINLNTNSAYYVDNGDGTCFGFPPFIPYPVRCTNPYYIQYNGFTVPLTASIAVVPCSTYRMKLAIADAGDGDIDSGVFFAASGINGGGLFCQGATNLSISFTTNLTCTAPNSGTATVNPVGGTPPYTYLWSDGQTTQTAVGLSAGTYDVTVTDNACSQANTNFSVVLSTTGPTITFTQTDIPCNGGTTGSATVNITGGTPPVTINWSNGVTTDNNPNLVAGTYDVTVTDNIGCLAIGSVTIAQASTLAATAAATASACGATTGTVTVTPSGGTPPYTYLWSNGPTTQSQNNLPAGSYDVTVTDAAGCIIIANAVVTTPTSFTLSLTTADGNCAQANSASIDLTVNGGTPPFTFIWSSGETTEDLTSIIAGTYTVTVSDGNGCQEITAATVTVPQPVAATATSTDVTCQGGNDGTATANPTTGIGPFTYLWSNNETTATISNLTAGTYDVTVTSAEGCEAFASTTITEPTLLEVTLAANNPTCTAPSSGDVTANPTGGTPPYSYAWSNGPTTQSQNNLVGNTYTVTVTDNVGCTVEASTVLATPSSFTLSLVTTNGNCAQANSASIDLTVNGGTPPFNFIWSNGETTEDLTNIIAGTYTVTVTDGNSCEEISAATVTVPEPVTATATSTDATCQGGNDGTATANPTAGVGPFTYLWSNTETTATITGLTAGTYDITVTSAEGCEAFASTTVAQPTALSVTIASTNPACPTLDNGDATATPAGGVGPYAYLWSNGDITATTNGLVAGTYTVVVTDDNGCTATASVTLTDPPVVVIAVTVTHELCNNPNSGTATVLVNAGTAPYDPLWSNGQSAVTTINNLAPGLYEVTVTDANGCTATANGTVNPATTPTVSLTPTDPGCNSASTGSLEATGNFTSFTWGHGALTNPSTGLAAGNYDITVEDANGCTATAAAVLNEPTALTLSLTPTPLDCNVPASGAVAATAGGGTAPLSYLWSNAATTASITNLVHGIYSVVVTDANGCTITDNVTLAAPNPPTLSLNITPVNCIDPNSAAIDAVVNGGTAPLTYAWSNSATTSGIANIGPGSYTVIVTDGNGCTVTASANISAIPGIALTESITDASCFGSADGTIDVFGAYTSYTWSHGATTMPATGLVAGTYTVVVEDNFGCTDSRTFVVEEPTELQLSLNATAIDCSDPNSGGLEAICSGGTPTYSYQWSNAATVPVLGGLGQGTYSVIVTDANGCTITATETLEPNPAGTVSLGANRVICAGDSTVFDLSSYAAAMVWHDGSTGNTFTASTAGTVSVTVSFPNGCDATDAATVAVNDKVELFAMEDTTLCSTEWVRFTAGPVGFVYEWSDGTLGPEIMITDSGSYVVTATSNCNVVQDTVTVNMEQCNCEVFLPNAFSPNGDGVNDEFRAYAACDRVEGFRLTVFDRWGAVVFTTTDFTQGWDGTMSNGLCVTGVYIWQVAYVEAINGRLYEESKKGSVVLLR